MITRLRSKANIFLAIAAMVPKMFLAYSIWVWVDFLLRIIAVLIQVAFWTAIFASSDSPTLGGLTLAGMLQYIILAQIFQPAVHASGTIYAFGNLMREGQIGIELLRPVDFQAALYVRNIADILVSLVVQIPFALVAWLIFHYTLPTDPLTWLAFIGTLLLGNAVLFCFDWILGCISFFSTETWGLSVLRFGIANFFSGAIIPLVIMPGWLQSIGLALPFAQALYLPVSLISGITPLSDVPGIWGMQLIYLVIFLALSRFIFSRAVRVVTVQGG